jgi:imidazole glycerol-phosphate synthase subunit HisH
MIAIIKYNAGNIKSVENSLHRLGYECQVTDNKEAILSAEKVIFPGVGEASTAMDYLKKHNLDELIKSLKQPTLGICLGQQLMCRFSEEGETTCLGIFNAVVKKFPPLELVPHMGWNNLEKLKGKLFDGIIDTDNVYFVHSYYAELSDETVAACRYILPFSAAMQKDNFYATQFHPEKSAGVGEQILKNFLAI